MPSPNPAAPTPDKDPCTWDVTRLISDLGGPANMSRTLQRHGLKVPAYDTIISWQKRGKLPTSWAATLVLCLVLERPQADVSMYIHDGNPFG